MKIQSPQLYILPVIMLAATLLFFVPGNMVYAQKKTSIIQGEAPQIERTNHNDVIDFEDIEPGTDLSVFFSKNGFGPIAISESAPIRIDHISTVFDSNCPGGICSGREFDLGAPNESFGGPGVGSGGEVGQPFENDTVLGNMLIVHDGNKDPLENPNATASMTWRFIYFPTPITLYNVTVVDVDEGEYVILRLFDEQQPNRFTTRPLAAFEAPYTGNNGKAVVMTDKEESGQGTTGVFSMIVAAQGTHALDNFVFIAEEMNGEVSLHHKTINQAKSDEEDYRWVQSDVEFLDTYELSQAYPNPFNPSTTIRFALPEQASVRLIIFDMLGREVERLVDGVREAGNHEVTFNASSLPSGTYLYRLETPEGSFTQRMLLLK